MFPNYKSKYHNSLPQHSNFKEETVRLLQGTTFPPAKTGSFTTNISAFNIPPSNELTEKKWNYIVQRESIQKEKHYSGTMSLITIERCVSNVKLHQSHGFMGLIIVEKNTTGTK